MSDLNKYIEFVKKWEGGLGKGTNDSSSKYPCPTPYKGVNGYHTNKGITYRAWVNVFGKDNDSRFFAMSDDDWWKVFHDSFWSKMQLDEIENFKVAALTCDIGWMSGTARGIITLQRGLKIQSDGIIGKQTLSAVNKANSIELLEAMYKERERFLREIGVGKNSIYLKGWLNRLENFKKVF